MGTAIVFVPLLAMTAMAVYATAVYAAHYFLVVVETTAHGNDETQWPAESFVEWLWKPFYLAAIAAVWAAPAALAGLAVAKSAGPLAGAAVGLGSLMLLYPIGQLSGFVADHPWVPFHPEALVRMILRPGVTLGFALIAVLALLPLALAGGYMAANPQMTNYGGPVVGPLLLSAAWLLYARVVGRLLFVLTYEKRSARSPADDVRLPVSGEPPPRPRRRRRPPAAAPKRAKPAGPETLPPLDRPKPSWDDEDDDPYAVHAPEVEEVKPATADVIRPKEREMRLLERNAVPPPRRAWGPEVWAFALQTETGRAWLTLGVFLVLLSVIARAAVSTMPH
jgi:hypothetical protein